MVIVIKRGESQDFKSMSEHMLMLYVGRRSSCLLTLFFLCAMATVCVAGTEGNGAVIRVGSIQCISDLDIILLATT